MYKLQVMQRKAIRIICHTSYNAHSSLLFKITLFLKLDYIYRLQINHLVYKLYKQTIPKPLIGLIPHNFDIHDHSTRHRKDSVNIFNKNHTVQPSFLVEGPKLWNSICENIKDLNFRQYGKEIKESLNHLYYVLAG